MKKTNKIILTASIVAVLLLGIGYAAIQNTTLNISGSAAADPSQSNFKVMFSGTPTVSDDTYVTAAITDDTNATVNVEGLTKKGDVVTATYTVQNASTDLSADLAVSTTNSNTEYFTLMSEIDESSLVAGEATTLTVTVELTKTPIVESVSTTIGVQLEAMPVQPGEEGTSEGINDFSQTPDNRNEYGFYYDKRYVTTIDGEVVGINFHEDTSCTAYISTQGTAKFPVGSVKYDSFSIDASELDLGVIEVSSDGKKLIIPDIIEDGDVIFEITDYKPLPNGAMYGSIIAEPLSTEWYDEMPKEPLTFDMYLYGDYCYFYTDGSWAVFLATEDGEISNLATDYDFTDKNQTSYGPIFDSINGKPVTRMISTFEGCDNLEVSPKLPSGLVYMDCTFMGCDLLREAPEIPDTVEDMPHAFYGCKSLKQAPMLPNNLTGLSYTFASCSLLTSAPEIPSSVKSLTSTFSGCTSLTKAPVIPKNVTDMSNTFSNCTGLTGEITINANPTSYYSCFFGVDFTSQNLTLKGESTMLDELGATGKNYTPNSENQ